MSSLLAAKEVETLLFTGMMVWSNSPQDDRIWWPFAVKPPEARSPQDKAEIEFLVSATSMGFRAFAHDSDLGAMTSDGRECHIVWRGSHRRELAFIDRGGETSKQLFTATEPGVAFREAAEAALRWLQRFPAPLSRHEDKISTVSVPADAHLPT